MTNSDKSKKLAFNYYLKSMVMARILAEMTVFVILLTLPLVLFAIGYLAKLSAMWIAMFCILAVISLIFLPAYGFITWKVTVTDEGLIARSILRTQKCDWQQIKGISKRSNFNWQRFVVECDDKDFSFSIWLKNVEQLVETIRSRLPGGGGASNPFRSFSQDPIALSFQLARAAIGIGFAGLSWVFLYEQWQKEVISNTDLIILLIFCLLLTACMLWRTIVILLMPKRVEVTQAFLRVQTLFFTKEYAWDEILEVKQSMPFLPEGIVIKVKDRPFLIDHGMDAADELISSVSKNIPEKK